MSHFAQNVPKASLWRRGDISLKNLVEPFKPFDTVSERRTVRTTPSTRRLTSVNEYTDATKCGVCVCWMFYRRMEIERELLLGVGSPPYGSIITMLLRAHANRMVGWLIIERPRNSGGGRLGRRAREGRIWGAG